MRSEYAGVMQRPSALVQFQGRVYKFQCCPNLWFGVGRTLLTLNQKDRLAAVDPKTDQVFLWKRVPRLADWRTAVSQCPLLSNSEQNVAVPRMSALCH
jgi:hypothetical protein